MKKILLFCMLSMFEFGAYAGIAEDLESNDPAFLYSKGEGLGKEGKHKVALEFYVKAAGMGHLQAQLAAADTYIKYNERDNAIVYLEKAATQGNVVAQNRLGLILYVKSDEGLGFEADAYKMAISLLTAAAEQGHFPSQLVLVHSYFDTGDPQKSRDLADVCAWTYYTKPTNDYYRAELIKIYNNGGSLYIDQAKANGYFTLGASNFSEYVNHCNNTLGVKERVEVETKVNAITQKVSGKRIFSLNNGNILEF